MNPILFDENAKDFTTNGIGRLSDCITCEVTEERNGVYEVEFSYPITGALYSEIMEGRIILVSHDEQKDLQPFEIYRRSAPINGIVTFNAQHISYKLTNVIVSPFTASSVTSAFESFNTHSMTDNPFTFWTDKSSGGSFEIKVPTSIRAALGGTKGSILDTFGGGEYKFDNYLVRLYQNRGNDSGVTIRYGKNLADLKCDTDIGSLYSAVIPYWSDGATTVVYGGVVAGESGIVHVADWTDENGVPIQDENGENITFRYGKQIVVPMDLSGEFEDAPTVAQLEAKARSILNNNKPWIPKVSIDVDFVQLWQTEEYKNVAPLERVQLCDTVSVYYEALGVNATAKVIKVVWDALTERYEKMELGDAKTSFAETIMADTEQLVSDHPTYSDMDLAIMNATNLITGGMGGHIVFLYDANGKPTDMLVMDTENVTTAVHVLRINVNGIGFSSNGVSGPFTSAWTLDGKFVADFITAGTMSAARIKGGTLVLGGVNNGNGSIVVYDASGNVIGRWNNAGIEINGGTVRTKDSVRASSIESGYSKYYLGGFNGTLIGTIGTGSIDNDGVWCLEMDLSYNGEGIFWAESTNAANTSFTPVLGYYRASVEALNAGDVVCYKNLHVTAGHTLRDSTIEDPSWYLDGTTYAGQTRSITINNTTMRFVRGILVNAY